MSTWSDMNAARRNHLVGSLIGAKMFSQCYLAVDGKRVKVTPYTEDQRGQVDILLNVLRSSDETWAEFKASDSAATDEWRAKLEIDVERWHARYSDTPGGAWMVVEWLHAECDAVVKIERHRFGVDMEMYSQGKRVANRTGTDFARTVCELLLSLKAPEALIG